MHSTREQLLSKYGNYSITVTTANTHSYPKGTYHYYYYCYYCYYYYYCLLLLAKMTLNNYVNIIMKPQEKGRLGSGKQLLSLSLYHVM